MRRKRFKQALLLIKNHVRIVFSKLFLAIKSPKILILNAEMSLRAIAKHSYQFLRNMERPSWFMAFLVPFLLFFTIIFGMTIENGYYYFSLETLFSVMIAAVAAIIIGAIGRHIALLHYAFIGAIIAISIDVYIVNGFRIAAVIYTIIISLTLLLHKHLTNAFYITLAVVFLLGIVIKFPPTGLNYMKKASEIGYIPNKTIPNYVISSSINNNKIVIHLVMDEMGALHSLPLSTERKKDVDFISKEYKKRGFTIYEPYYSYSRETISSVRNLLGIDKGNEANDSLEMKNKSSEDNLSKVSIHDLYIKNNWNVSILQPDYVNVCISELFNCKTYNFFNQVNQVQTHETRWSTRFNLWQYELLYKFAVANSTRQILPFFMYNAVSPEWLQKYLSVFHPGISRPFAMINSLEDERNDLPQKLTKSTKNNLIYMHILLPHHPYILDRNCQIKPRQNWDDLSQWVQRDYEHLVQAYWDQFMCTQEKLFDFIDAIDRHYAGHVQYIIHGDHGTRLARGSPSVNLSITYDQSLSEAIKEIFFSPFIAMRINDSSLIPTNAKTMQELVRSVLIALAAGKQK